MNQIGGFPIDCNIANSTQVFLSKRQRLRNDIGERRVDAVVLSELLHRLNDTPNTTRDGNAIILHASIRVYTGVRNDNLGERFVDRVA